MACRSPDISQPSVPASVLIGRVFGEVPTALKHAFDVCYYPCLDTTRGRPFGLYLHGNEGTEGAERGVMAITTGLGWVKAAETVVVSGKPSKSDLQACWNFGATVAAQLMG